MSDAAEVKAEDGEVKAEVKSEDALPGDEHLKETTREILKAADLESVTKKTVRRSLEAKLGLGDGALDVKKSQINEWVDQFMAEQQGEEDDDEEEEEEAVEEAPTKKSRGWGSQYLKPALATFMNLDSCPRSDVVKEIWRHTKEHGLQDPKDKRYIVCDERLFALFQKKRIHMFKMNSDLSKHFGEKVGSEAPAKEEEPDGDDDDGSDSGEGSGSRKRKAAPTPKAKPAKKAGKSKGTGGGFQAPVQLSAELQDLLGCGETLPRTEMVKQLWAYIKANELQNPKNKSEILPDSKMKPVFGSKPFTGFSMMKLLKPHVSKPE